jgi:hypothetical protein
MESDDHTSHQTHTVDSPGHASVVTHIGRHKQSAQISMVPPYMRNTVTTNIPSTMASSASSHIEQFLPMDRPEYAIHIDNRSATRLPAKVASDIAGEPKHHVDLKDTPRRTYVPQPDRHDQPYKHRPHDALKDTPRRTYVPQPDRHDQPYKHRPHDAVDDGPKDTVPQDTVPRPLIHTDSLIASVFNGTDTGRKEIAQLVLSYFADCPNEHRHDVKVSEFRNTPAIILICEDTKMYVIKHPDKMTTQSITISNSEVTKRIQPMYTRSEHVKYFSKRYNKLGNSTILYVIDCVEHDAPEGYVKHDEDVEEY